EVIFRLNKDTGQTFVIVTHDQEVAKRAHRAVHVIDGVLAEPGAEARPRGFADVKFKLRGDAEQLRRTLHPTLAGVLCLFPPLAPGLALPLPGEVPPAPDRRRAPSRAPGAPGP